MFPGLKKRSFHFYHIFMVIIRLLSCGHKYFVTANINKIHWWCSWMTKNRLIELRVIYWSQEGEIHQNKIISAKILNWQFFEWTIWSSPNKTGYSWSTEKKTKNSMSRHLRVKWAKKVTPGRSGDGKKLKN